MTSHAARLAVPTRATSRAPSLVAQAAMAGVATACIAGGLAIAQAYPAHAALASAAFALWFVFAAFRFEWAWPAAIALLPVVDLAPRTGWYTFEEFDLVVLATAAGGYAHRILQAYVASHGSQGSQGSRASIDPSRHDRPRLSLIAVVLTGSFLASTAISMARGFDAAGGFRFDWTQGYDDPLNALRIFKSFALATLMTPLVLHELGRPRAFDRLALGLTASLALGALAVLQERFAFTGLLDFSGDYRVTGSFWEMHIGGAALDGFLAMTIPFAVREAMRRGSPGHFIGAVVVLALAAYASLVTFSRGVYAAVPLSLLVAAVLVFRQKLRIERGALWSWLARGVVFAIAVAACGLVVFRSGGYRAAAALLVLLGATVLIEGVIRRSKPASWVAAGLVAALVATVMALLAASIPKGPYVAVALATLACVFASWRADRAPDRRSDLVAIAAYLWLAIAAVDLARQWGGTIALRDAGLVCLGIVVVTFASRAMPIAVWPTARRGQLATLAFAALVMAAVTVFTAGAYMGGRFSHSESDLQSRKDHWSEGIGRLRTVDEWMLGKGLGRFPATSLYDSRNAEFPGSYHLRRRDGETFLALSGPRIRYLGFGELFRFSQRVDVVPDARYRLLLEARSTSALTVHVEICEKQLIYNAGCVIRQVGVAAGDGEWTTSRLELDTAGLGRAGGLATRPLFFSVAVDTPGAVVELRRLRLAGPGGIDAIRNGDFRDRTTHWFSSSDKFHLPFHIKNLALDVLFDQGVIGLVLFGLLVGGAALRVVAGRARQHPDAPFIAASIVGFLVVGLFDSLLDVPRVAFLFYVVVLIGLMLRNPSVRSAKGEAVSDRVETHRVESPVPDDDAAARALRRQRAFGSRRPASEDTRQ